MSKIGLIARTVDDVLTWRRDLSITEEHAPWLKFVEQVPGFVFYSLVLLPGWKLRPRNRAILERARPQLVRPSGAELEAEAVADAAVAAILPADEPLSPYQENPLTRRDIDSAMVRYQWREMTSDTVRYSAHDASTPVVRATPPALPFADNFRDIARAERAGIVERETPRRSRRLRRNDD